MPYVSVILPVYNAEKYLPATLDCLLAQTFKDFEIVAVNDSSPDHSLQILEEYQKKDSRIKIITQPNGGQSGARNTAIKNATGDFIMLCDNDDIMNHHAMEILHDIQVQTDADLVCHAFKRMKENDKYEDLINDIDVKKVYTAKNLMAVYNKDINIMPWSKLYRRYIFDKVQFPKVVLGEDYYSTLMTFLQAKKVVYIKNKLHFHRQYETQTSAGITERKLREIFNVTHMLDQEFKNQSKINQKAFIKYASCFQLYSLLTLIFKTEDRPLFDIYVQLWQDLIKQTMVTPAGLTIGRKFVMNAVLTGNYDKAKKRFMMIKKIRF